MTTRRILYIAATVIGTFAACVCISLLVDFLLDWLFGSESDASEDWYLGAIVFGVMWGIWEGYKLIRKK